MNFLLKLNRRLVLLSTVVACTFSTLSGCGGGAGAGAIETPTGLTAEVKALRDYMQESYLWYREMPNPDLSQVATAKEALDLLVTKPKDRYSYIDTAEAQTAFFVEGKSVGAGFGMVEREGKLLISYVRPGSPAESSGLQRGDQIITANGVTVNTLASANEAIGPREAGISLAMELNRAGNTVNVSMVKAQYDIITVSNTSVQVSNGRRVGYLYFFAFIDRTVNDWNAAIANLRAQGAQDLVVDLRHNGGGYLNTAGIISGTLRKTLPASGELLTRLNFNDKRQSDNSIIRVGTADTGSRFDKLIFLTTEGSCSASEALMNGLAPYQTVISIGSKTCGKPVGFNPRTVGDQVFSIVTFEMVNSQGFGTYYDGLPVNCPVTDTFTGQFGTATEPLMGAALQFIASGTCPSVAVTGATTKATTTKTTIGSAGGVAGQWGLY